jgi:membrane protein
MASPAHNTPDWEGRQLLDREGAKIGTIEEIYLVEETGRPEWALVKLGRIGRRATLVPISGATATDDGVRAGYAKAIVSEAPAVDSGTEPSEEQVAAIYRHYGIGAEPAPADDGNGTGAAPQGAQEQPADQGGAQPAPAGDGNGTGAAPQRAHEQPAARGAAGGPPSKPGEGDSTVAMLKRTVKEFSDDNLTHWAAALTYYGVLSIFPALLATVSILGLIGSSAIQPLLDNLSEVAPGPAKEILTSALQGLQQGGGSGVLFIVALAGALWSASGYISAFMDASNAIYDVDEGRPIWKKLPLRIAVTVLMVILLAAGAVAVVLTGPIAEEAGSLFGVGDSALAVWDIAKWPVLVLIVSFMLAVLYYVTPNVRQPGLRAVLAGGLLAVVLWILVSLAFAFYVANFGSYNKTYGAFGGVIVFLVWLWLTNLAILLGAQFNAERARGRNIDKGHAAGEEPYLPLRDEP